MIRIDDADRIRTVTLDRPEALNAFNEALYDATADALADAAGDPGVAVVVITGAGRAFSAGQDLLEMAMVGSPDFVRGRHGFPGMIDQLIEFPKPLLCAVNGLGLGAGATVLALADLVLMSADARIKCPFTSLAVAPEAGSSVTFPTLMGRQAASWALLSSEWLSAAECVAAGLAWKVCAPSDLLPETMRHARVLASKPITSLVESKALIVGPHREAIRAARAREDQAFQRLLGTPANVEALRAFAEKREPDFAAVDAAAAARSDPGDPEGEPGPRRGAR